MILELKKKSYFVLVYTGGQVIIYMRINYLRG